MSYNKISMEYHINLEALHEMEEIVPMTRRERDLIRKWVKKGS